MDKPIRLGNIYGENKGTGFAGNVWDKRAVAPTLTSMQGGGRQPMILDNKPFVVASRGRNPDNPSDRTKGIKTEQILEPNKQGLCNTLTSVQKDNYVVEPPSSSYVTLDEQNRYLRTNGTVGAIMTDDNNSKYNSKVVDEQARIRKLTPKECWRLMGFSDEDFAKAEAVNSNTQLYKQAGNSIVVNVLMAVFWELLL